jgi:hypothetical protein
MNRSALFSVIIVGRYAKNLRKELTAMGSGIAAVIPIVHKITNAKYIRDDYLEAFDLNEETSHYLLKLNVLFDHFKAFLTGFNDIIEEKDELWIDSKWEELEELAKRKDYAGYLDYLDENSNRSVPFYERSRGAVSLLGMDVKKSIVFYSGSYKAYLEEYSTLSHMEKLLLKAFDNPLSKVAKFCIFG